MDHGVVLVVERSVTWPDAQQRQTSRWIDVTPTTLQIALIPAGYGFAARLPLTANHCRSAQPGQVRRGATVHHDEACVRRTAAQHVASARS